MELLYNPERMSEEEIKATFVARQPLVDKLVGMIKSQPDGAGVQHVVIIAPRGMGKTTVLLMVKFAIRDRGLAKQWQAVKFPEESYSIYDLADFWIQTLELLAVETGDDAPRVQAEELKRKYPNNDDLQEAALAAIKDWRRKHKKRLLLLVENFDMILEQINDEHDNARLRDALMNDGTMMLIGGATTFFKEARAYDQPLYNFFQIENLSDLRFEQMQELLRSRAQRDAIPDFEATLKANAGRLRTLEYFTGGNPRLVLMLYRVVTQSDIGEVRRGLEKLLDEVTPYYKAKIEALPPQQRKILDHIARISGKTNEGLTPAEIAEAVRLSPNQVSAQLKRLSEIGYVRAVNLRGRSVPYTLSEPLYAIWHQMRFGRDARERMQWLVNFLKSWYDREEMEVESERLTTRFQGHLQAKRLQAARDTLEHHRYLTEAMDDGPIRASAIEKVIRGHLEIGDGETIKKELLVGVCLEELSTETLQKLRDNRCIGKDEMTLAIKKRRAENKAIPNQNQKFAELMAQAAIAYEAGRPKDALRYLNKAAEIKQDEPTVWNNRGIVLDSLGEYKEALESYGRALNIQMDNYQVWNNRGVIHASLGNFKEAISNYDFALILNPDYYEAWNNRGSALANLGMFDEAIKSYDKSLEIKPDFPEAWVNRGHVLRNAEKFQEAMESYDKALTIKQDCYEAWVCRGLILDELDRYKDAVVSYDKALAIKFDKPAVWMARGTLLLKLGRFDDAINSYDRALELDLNSGIIWERRGIAFLAKCIDLIAQQNLNHAKLVFTQALESGKQSQGKKWLEALSFALQFIAKRGHHQLARDLLRESGFEEQLFPLARALDYLLTNDEALIERLSPEVKGIVQQVVDKLRPVAKNTRSSKKKTNKS